MFSSQLMIGTAGLKTLYLTQVESNVNLFTKMNSPSYPGFFLVVLEASAIITTMVMGNFAAGSIIRMVNKGYILGAGGDGGASGWAGTPVEPGENPFPGLPGQAALSLSADLILDCSVGNIWGGGGGGGGAIGFGGGGGVSGGAGGFGIVGGVPGNPGGTGINATPGQGGGGSAGAGGSWGMPGEPGQSPIPGGNSGRSIQLNGFSVTYLTTNEAQLFSQGRLKGAVS